MKTMKRRAKRFKWSRNSAANLALLSQVKPKDYVAVRMSNGGEHKGIATMLPGGPKHGVFFYDVLNGKPFSVQHLQDDVDSFYHAPAADSSGAEFRATGEDADGREAGHDEPLYRDETFSGDVDDVPQGDRPEKRRKRAESRLSLALSEYAKLTPTGKDSKPLRRSALSEDVSAGGQEPSVQSRCTCASPGRDPQSPTCPVHGQGVTLSEEDADDAERVTVLIDLLRKEGIRLDPDTTDASNFIPRLLTALHALHGGDVSDEDADDPRRHYSYRNGRDNPEDVRGMSYLMSLNRIKEKMPILEKLALRQSRDLERRSRAERSARLIRRIVR